MPTTDTRAALERELRDNADWLALGARQGMELSQREVADLAEILTQAADYLTLAAPEERGEGELLHWLRGEMDVIAAIGASTPDDHPWVAFARELLNRLASPPALSEAADNDKAAPAQEPEEGPEAFKLSAPQGLPRAAERTMVSTEFMRHQRIVDVLRETDGLEDWSDHDLTLLADRLYALDFALARPAAGSEERERVLSVALSLADRAPWRQSVDMDLLKDVVSKYRAALRGQGEAP